MLCDCASPSTTTRRPESARRASARLLSLGPLPPDARTPLVEGGEPPFVVVEVFQVRGTPSQITPTSDEALSKWSHPEQSSITLAYAFRPQVLAGIGHPSTCHAKPRCTEGSSVASDNILLPISSARTLCSQRLCAVPSTMIFPSSSRASSRSVSDKSISTHDTPSSLIFLNLSLSTPCVTVTSMSSSRPLIRTITSG